MTYFQIFGDLQFPWLFQPHKTLTLVCCDQYRQKFQGWSGKKSASAAVPPPKPCTTTALRRWQIFCGVPVFLLVYATAVFCFIANLLGKLTQDCYGDLSVYCWSNQLTANICETCPFMTLLQPARKGLSREFCFGQSRLVVFGFT